MDRHDLKGMTPEELKELEAVLLELRKEREADTERDGGQAAQRVEGLAARDREVLEHLHRTRALTTNQIARLCFGGDESTAYTSLVRLQAGGFIRGLELQGRPCGLCERTTSRG